MRMAKRKSTVSLELAKGFSLHKQKIVTKPESVDTGGVTYDRRVGAECPMCRLPKCYVRDTMPWQDDIRIRYHVCRRCGHLFKSVEEYTTA